MPASATSALVRGQPWVDGSPSASSDLEHLAHVDHWASTHRTGLSGGVHTPAATDLIRLGGRREQCVGTHRVRLGGRVDRCAGTHRTRLGSRVGRDGGFRLGGGVARGLTLT